MFLFVLVKIKSFFTKKGDFNPLYIPNITFLVAAYNEADYIASKIENSLKLKYPKDKIQFIFVTDGSTDHTPEIIKKFPEIQLLHKSERQGKIAAIDRAMTKSTGEIVVYSDANSLLNIDALVNIVFYQ